METFEATIEDAPRGAFVRVPREVVAALGGKGRIPVNATFDGVAYRGSVVSMGGDDKIIGLLKGIRADLGKAPGDTVTVTLEPDRAERSVTVPDDLAAALDQAGLRTAFDALSYSQRRQHVAAIEDAKRPETRARRVARTVGTLGVRGA